jgi:hypothetical protein
VSPLPAPTGSPLRATLFRNTGRHAFAIPGSYGLLRAMNTSALDFDSANQPNIVRVSDSLPLAAGAFAQHPGHDGFSGRRRILTPLRTSDHG